MPGEEYLSRAEEELAKRAGIGRGFKHFASEAALLRRFLFS
jgi:hypothetical protein